MQECVHQTDTQRIDEEKQLMNKVLCNLDQDIINAAIDQWCTRLSMCTCEGRLFRAHHVNSQ